MKVSRSLLTSVIAVVLALTFSTLCLAQSAPATPAHNLVIIVHVKADMLNEWIDLQKNELIPAEKKGGVASRTTYQTLFGNSLEYVTVIPLEKYALLDGPTPQVRALGAPGAARLAAKLAKCVESRQLFMSIPLPELSNAPANELPPMGVFTRVRVAPGKAPDYQNFIKSEILPIYKKANVGSTVTRRGLGANANDFVQVSWLSKAADLDAGSPILRALGPEGAAKLLARTAGMATLVEQVVRRRVPELSY